VPTRARPPTHASIRRSEAATDESRDTERRLRDALAGRRPAGLGSGSALAAPGGANGAAARPAAPAAQQRPPLYGFAAKCRLGGETRLLHLAAGVTYAQLLDAVQTKFPGTGAQRAGASGGEGRCGLAQRLAADQRTSVLRGPREPQSSRMSAAHARACASAREGRIVASMRGQTLAPRLPLLSWCGAQALS
jgi:hypothetical protein